MALSPERKRMIKASFVLFGTIVGAGIFGLPYMVQRAGFLPGLFWMVVLAGAVTLTHLLYGEVVMATPGEHRLVGYVKMYLGPWAHRVEMVASVIGLFGSILAYLILGGLFISSIFQALGLPLSQAQGSATLFLFGLAAAWFGTKFLSGVDFWLTLVEFGSFTLLSIIAFTGFHAGNLATIHLDEAFLPYGIVLFAYGGLTAISEVRAIVGADPRAVRKSIMAGTLMAAALTMFFVTSVVGALGPDVTPEAVGGLNARFGGPLPLIGAIAGFFSVLTSYIVFSEYLKSQFQKDFRWPKAAAVAAATAVPLVLFLLGVRSFGSVIEFIGALLIGLEGIFVAWMYLRVRAKYPEKVLRVPPWLVHALMGVYAAGMAYTILT
jgi:amino acid permease